MEYWKICLMILLVMKSKFVDWAWERADYVPQETHPKNKE